MKLTTLQWNIGGGKIRKITDDRVLYSGLTHVKTVVDNTTLTDHYPVYSEFELDIG